MRKHVVNHEPNVRLVDPHPKSHRRHDDLQLVLAPLSLNPLPLHRLQSRVVKPDLSLISLVLHRFLQVFAHLLARHLRSAVNDPRVVQLLRENVRAHIADKLPMVLLRSDLVAELRPIKRLLEHQNLLPVHQEQLQNVVLHRRRRRRRERHQRHVLEELKPHLPELFVVHAEVVAPLTHAVDLVDHEQRQKAQRAQRTQQVLHALALVQLLWGRVHQLQPRKLPCSHRIPQSGRDLAATAARHRAHLHAGFLQPANLVLDERNQRRDDDGDAREEESGQLVAQTLASACGHDAKHAPSRQHGLHDLHLPRPEGVVAKNLLVFVEQFFVGNGQFFRSPEILRISVPSSNVTEKDLCSTLAVESIGNVEFAVAN